MLKNKYLANFFQKNYFFLKKRYALGRITELWQKPLQLQMLMC